MKPIGELLRSQSWFGKCPKCDAAAFISPRILVIKCHGCAAPLEVVDQTLEPMLLGEVRTARKQTGEEIVYRMVGIRDESLSEQKRRKKCPNSKNFSST